LERTESVIAREEARAYSAIAPYKARLQGKRVLLITGGVKSWSVVAALQESGLEVVGTSVKKSTKEDKARIKEIMGDDAHMIDDMTPREMYRMLKEARADIMLSGGRSQFIALKAKMPWLDINQERQYAYMGYVGMVALVHEIDKALSNPVWEQVRLKAPWEEVTWQERAEEGGDVSQHFSLNEQDSSLTVSDSERRRTRIVCSCAGVDRASIEDAIVGFGLKSVDEISRVTGAGTGCGGCIGKAERILGTQDHWRKEVDIHKVSAA
jgi:nitrogenase molybdenum-cofactor synthesis protein NifE